MRTFTFKPLLKAFLLIISIGFFNAAMATCSASFTYSIGINGHATLTSTSTWSTGLASYIWNAGDGSGNQYGYGSTFTHIYTANGTYKAALTLNIDSGATCSSTDTVSIVVTNVTYGCTLSANANYTQGANGFITFNSTSTGTYANTLYYWTPGDGGPRVQGTNTYTHTYAYTGYYNAWLVVEDTGSAYCIDSTMIGVSVTTADSNSCNIHPGFTYSIGSNGHVTFTSTTYSTTIDSNYLYYQWSAGDGGTMVDSICTHIYIANGTYNIRLVVSYGPYCVDSITIPVTISNVTTPCTLSASFTETNDTAKGRVNFVSTSTGTNAETQYWWNPGDGSLPFMGGSNVNYTYTANGVYTASLVIKDTGTQYCVDSNSVYNINISNVDSLKASFNTVNVFDTAGEYEYQFTSTSTGVNNVTMYLWNPGDTTAADSGLAMTSYTHYYKYPGTHTVTLSLWFTKYPIIKPHGMMGSGTRYDFTTYSKTIDVGKPTGIATITDATSGLNIYPTPNSGQFKLSLTGVANGNADVEIINVLGETMYNGTMQINNGKLQQNINLQNAPNGSYFIRVVTAGKVYVGRTVISNR